MLSLILPCYNEGDNLRVLMESLDRLASAYSDLEIILVNNGSTDHSADILESLISNRNSHIFRTVKVEKNIGYGFGILSGLRAAKGEILAVTHADRQTDPMDVLKALEIYRANQNKDSMLLVKGYRKNRRPAEAIFSYLMALLASAALGVRMTEINAQPKLFSSDFFRQVEQRAPHDFSLDLYLLYMAKRKGRILDFPVDFSPRVAGESKGGSGSTWKVKWKLIKRSFTYIFELRRSLKQAA